MKVLSIDTSAETGGITLVADDKTFNFRIESTYRVAENIYGYIDRFFQLCGICLNDIDLFSTILGPGSFTGLRVSLSVVKSFSYTLNKPVIGIGTFNVMAYIAASRKDSESIIVLGNARRGEIFCSVYDRNLTVLEDTRIIKPQEILTIKAKYFHHSVVLRDREILKLAALDERALILDMDLSNYCSLLSIELFKKGSVSEIADLEPVYVRDDVARKNICF